MLMPATALIRFISQYWLPFGLFMLLTGMYIVPSKNAFKTVFYLSFLLPSLLLTLANWRQARREYYRGSTLILGGGLSYFALSASWGSSFHMQYYFEAAAMILVSGYGLFYLYAHHRSSFVNTCKLAILMVAGISLFWMVEYYLILGHSLEHRFFKPPLDHFGLYRDKYYGAFHNPLLLSHVLVFHLTLLLGLFFNGYLKAKGEFYALLVAGVIILAFLLLNQTRMAYLLVVCIIAYNLIDKWATRGLLIALGLSSVAALALYWKSDLVFSRGFSYRPEIWLECIKLILQEPWLGHGMGADIQIKITQTKRIWADTHNIYLSLLFYGGVLGFSIILAFLFSLFRQCLSDQEGRRWCVSWILVVTLSGLTDGGGFLMKPGEHWFSLTIPLLLLLAHAHKKALDLRQAN